MKKMIAMVLVLCMILGMMPVIAMAADGAQVYLKPNSNWKADNARFAIYYFGNGDGWANMTDSDGDGVYEAVVPAGYPNVIFCRNPRCITTIEQELPHVFKLVDEKKGLYRCIYCESKA